MFKKSIFTKIAFFFLLISFSNNLFAKIPVGKAAIIIDFDTQETLFEVNADTLNFPASLTKMMTLYIVFDYLKRDKISWNTKMTVSKTAASKSCSCLDIKEDDKILEISDSYIIGLKNVTMNEEFFKGHFPGKPIFPGVLQIEAMAQAGGVLFLNNIPDPENYLTFFAKIDNAKFKYPVVPGDTIIFKLELLSPIRRGIMHMKGQAFVDNKLTSEAELLARIIRKTEA